MMINLPIARNRMRTLKSQIERFPIKGFAFLDEDAVKLLKLLSVKLSPVFSAKAGNVRWRKHKLTSSICP